MLVRYQHPVQQIQFNQHTWFASVNNNNNNNNINVMTDTTKGKSCYCIVYFWFWMNVEICKPIFTANHHKHVIIVPNHTTFSVFGTCWQITDKNIWCVVSINQTSKQSLLQIPVETPKFPRLPDQAEFWLNVLKWCKTETPSTETWVNSDPPTSKVFSMSQTRMQCISYQHPSTQEEQSYISVSVSGWGPATQEHRLAVRGWRDPGRPEDRKIWSTRTDPPESHLH